MRRGGLILYLGGLVAIVAAAAQWHAVNAPEPYVLAQSARLVWWSVFSSTMVATAYALGLPELPQARREVVARSGVAFAVGLVSVSVIQLALAVPLLPRSALLLSALVVPVWGVLCWNLVGDAERRGAARDRVLLVVARQEDAGALREELGRRPEVPAQLAGVLSVAEAQIGPGGENPLLVSAAGVRPTLVVLDAAAQADPGVVAQAAALHRTGVRVRSLALFYESWLGKLPIAELARVSLLFDIGELHRVRYTRFKRVIDLVVAGCGAVVMLAFVPVLLIVNRVANPGPLLYRQERVGRDGQVFSILKFRSMVGGGSSEWTTEDDARITPFGRILRRTHMDELPQMVNILRGELSLVGPRPEQVAYVEELRSKVPFYDVRHLVRPGLTGWAQVKQGYASSDSDAMEKLQYDFFYLRRQGIVLDVRIIWRTLRGVVQGSGR